MIKISEYDPDLVNEIVKFRRETYVNSGRHPSSLNEWSGDDFDRKATHVVMFDEEGKIIGVVRIITGEKWTIDDYYDFEYDKINGVEFGRLAISRPSHNGKRVLSELIKAACRHCATQGRTHFYGFVIARLKKELQRLRVPFEELSPAVAPMGEDSFLIRFGIEELIQFQPQNGTKKHEPQLDEVSTGSDSDRVDVRERVLIETDPVATALGTDLIQQ